MNKTTDNDKRQVLRVFGLGESELEALRKLAEKNTVKQVFPYWPKNF